MKADENKLRCENDLDELVRSSYGLSDSQLEDDLQLANHLVDDSLVPPSPKNGFQQLMEKKEKRKIKGYQETHPVSPVNAEEVAVEEPVKTLWIFTRTGRALIAACIMITVLMSSGLTVSGKRSYEYIVSERENIKNDIALNNDNNKQKVDDLEMAYDQIHDEIGITVLRLGYIPIDMEFEDLIIDKKHATLIFTYQGNKIFFIQDLKIDSSSANIVSSRKIVDTVNNEWVGQDVAVKSLLLQDGRIEYSSEIRISDAYYYITGVMDLDEFILIIEGLSYF